jgi:8-oxo-dGTP pyrophosphatase MutT (NUDIX family)
MFTIATQVPATKRIIMWLEASRRIRARWHYVRFFFLSEWPAAIGITGLVIGFPAFGSAGFGLPFVVAVAGLFLGVFSFGREIQEIMIRRSRYQFVKVMTFPVAKLKTRYRNQGVKFIEIPNRGTVLLSDKINQVLQTQDIGIRMNERGYRLPRKLRAMAPQAFQLSGKNSVVFNGRLLSMAGDIKLGSTDSTVTLRATRYFDSLCSNELGSYRVIHRDTNEEVSIYENEVCDPKTGRLRTFQDSRLSNHIGISTLAFTTDKKLVVCVQSRNNVPSKVLYAPSGSGTIPPKDYKQGDSLQGLLIRAMERELFEETGIRADDVEQTEVIGFGRWLERGAKPEFYGVTRLSITSREFEERQVKLSERLYTSQIKTSDVDLDGIRKHLLSGTQLVNSSHCADDLRNSGSVPLLVGLHLAAMEYGN